MLQIKSFFMSTGWVASTTAPTAGNNLATYMERGNRFPIYAWLSSGQVYLFNNNINAWRALPMVTT